MIKENEYMRIEYKKSVHGRTGKRILKEEAILQLLKKEMNVEELRDKINIEGEFLKQGTMWRWLIEREKEGKVVRRYEEGMERTLWRTV